MHTHSDSTLRNPQARREPTPEELEKMKALVDRGMREGAFGMSTGLIYPPSSYGKTDEIVALAEVVAAHGGIYTIHMRDEEAGLVVFDPQTFRDQAAFENPQQYATGVRWVFLAGKAAVTNGKPYEDFYGRALRHTPKAAM